MASLSYDKEAEIIQAFISTTRYLADLLNIDNPFFFLRAWQDEFIHLNFS